MPFRVVRPTHLLSIGLCAEVTAAPLVALLQLLFLLHMLTLLQGEFLELEVLLLMLLLVLLVQQAAACAGSATVAAASAAVVFAALVQGGMRFWVPFH